MKEMRKAVTLKYPEGAYAPFITAGGTGETAERMIEIAEKLEIPVVKDDFLADFLSVQQIGTYIPEECWNAVAGIFAFICDLEK